MDRTTAPLPTPERLRELFNYDASTGVLSARVHRRGTVCVGRPIGQLSKAGYLRCVVDGRRMTVARIAWAVHHGQHPAQVIDHINGVRNDNRIANLRDISNGMNAQNYREATARSKTAVLGVRKHSGPNFIVSIDFLGKTLHAYGLPDTESAYAYYVELKRRLHDGCTL